ncbi:2-keto-4-pentenoate hydratase [Streptomyces malaysiensis]|uniref:2-keto-4-pentenoate hydratase n=1 Tax=Streptomyces malaysiensis subsp. samsunensis TaxID=459658 RepID=A0A9X2LUY7_STRMQ|nr:2-keto-4-pentenoate hydratase [Streptomyces samsunensis]MCQ8830019.1 2-keto-4-pentenoate hydratase [Streptomyces samsunensis]
MNAEEQRKYAQTLLRAYADRLGVRPATADGAGLTESDAYAVQQLQVRHWEQSGHTVRGWRIAEFADASADGNPPADGNPARLAYGHLMSPVFHPESRPIDAGAFVEPRVAPAIAFVLGQRLSGPGLHTADAASAIAYALPALELLDSRLRDAAEAPFADLIADNAAVGGVVLGSRQTRPYDFQPRMEGCVLHQGGRPVATGVGAAVHGSPFNAVTWLANTLGAAGVVLPAGSVLLSGPLTPAVPVAHGQSVTAAFTHLGSVTGHFVTGPLAHPR